MIANDYLTYKGEPNTNYHSVQSGIRIYGNKGVLIFVSVPGLKPNHQMV